MTDSHRRLGLGALLVAIALCTAPTLLALRAELLGNRGSLVGLIFVLAALSTLLCLAGGVALIVPGTRWSRWTERAGQSALALLLLGSLLNLLMSLPAVRLSIALAGTEAAPQAVSMAINLLVLLWFWRDAMSVLGAGFPRNCPWRFTVFACLSVLVPVAAGLASNSEGGFNVAFGETGTVLRGFQGASWWSRMTGVSALLAIVCAATHQRVAVWTTAWMAVCLATLAPLLALTISATGTMHGLHSPAGALLSYAAAPLFLAALFVWLALELRSRVSP
jgi:hypothetical protein